MTVTALGHFIFQKLIERSSREGLAFKCEVKAVVKSASAFLEDLSSLPLTTASLDPCTQVHKLTLQPTQLHTIK